MKLYRIIFTLSALCVCVAPDEGRAEDSGFFGAIGSFIGETLDDATSSVGGFVMTFVPGSLAADISDSAGAALVDVCDLTPENEVDEGEGEEEGGEGETEEEGSLAGDILAGVVTGVKVAGQGVGYTLQAPKAVKTGCTKAINWGVDVCVDGVTSCWNFFGEFICDEPEPGPLTESGVKTSSAEPGAAIAVLD